MTSLSPDITEALPAELGSGLSDTLAQYPRDAGWDVVFGGLGFRLHPSPSHPYERSTDTVSKQQFDASTEAGEQSLSAWWFRSQASWHMGTGVVWYEPGAEPETANRFQQSVGVDPWTQGELTLLRRSVATTTTGPTFVNTLRRSGEEGFTLTVEGDAVSWVDAAGTVTELATPSITTVTQPALSGPILWIGHSAGITRVDTSDGTTVEAYTADAPCRVWWVKGRLVVAVGAALYEVPPRDTTGGDVETDGTLLFTHPVAEWSWTGVDETAGAVLAAGAGSAESSVYRFTLTEDEVGDPVWSSGEQVAILPPGETVHCMGVYLGSFVVLGTSLGARVGQVNAAGDVAYGPVTVPTTSPVVAVTFRDRFAYVAVTGAQPDDTSGCARIDLSLEQDGWFPWAWDASTGDGTEVLSIATVGVSDRVVLGGDKGLFTQHATEYVSEGWVDTGQVRFRTVEQKAFRLFRLNARLEGGQITTRSVAPDGTAHRLYIYTPETGVDLEAPITIPRRPLNTHLTFRLVLKPTTDKLASPVVTGWQVKALPAPTRMELIRFPVLIFDLERDRYGVQWGSEGGAFNRYRVLKALEETSAPIRVEETRTGENYTAIVERVEFVSETPPKGPEANFGGLGLVTVRRL